jgi:hypothetical protein
MVDADTAKAWDALVNYALTLSNFEMLSTFISVHKRLIKLLGIDISRSFNTKRTCSQQYMIWIFLLKEIKESFERLGVSILDLLQNKSDCAISNSDFHRFRVIPDLEIRP